MLKMKALKAEMAKAVLVAGIAGTTPAFAQDADNIAAPDVDVATQTETQAVNVSDSTRDWYNPEIPESVFFGLMLLAMAGTGYFAYRKSEGTVARAVALGIGFAAIANPQNVTDEYRTLPTIIPVFVDKSESVGDRAPRVEEAFRQLETDLASLGPVSIRRIEFGADGESLAKPGTYFADALGGAFDTIPQDQLGGAFVIGDGVLYDQSRFLDIRQMDVPVHSVIAGHEEEQDFYVKIEEVPRVGIVGEDQNILFRIVDGRTPESENLRADVNLFYGGELVQTMNVPLNATRTIALSDLAPDGLQIGKNLIEIAISDLQGARLADMDRDGDSRPDEVTMENNRITTTIEGIDSEIKVLFMPGEPYPGTDFWRTLLINDSNVSLTNMAYLRPPSKEDATPLRDLATTAFPVRELLHDKIDEFDMIIIDNYRFNGVIPLEYFGEIRDYVEDGGSLLLIGAEDLAAPNSLSKTQLGDILPLSPQGSTIDRRFIPEISEDGMRHPVGRALLGGMGGRNWGPWYSLVDSNVSGDATVLMTDGNNNPLLALGHAGKGRVAVLGSDQNAVWASGHEGGGPAATLYRSLAGWLTANPAYEEENLTLTQKDGEIIVNLQTMEDEAVPVIITTPSGEEIEIMPEADKNRPGTFIARIPADEKGAYRARREGANGTQAYAGSGFQDQTEIQNVISDTEILRPLSDKTGGQTTRITDVGGAFTMPVVKAAGDETVTDPNAMAVNMSTKKELVGTERQPLLPGWLYALAFAGALLYSFKPKDKNPVSWAKSTLGRNRNNKNGPDAPSV